MSAALPILLYKATPHNSRLTAYAPLRRLRHGICVAKMLDNVGSRYPHRASGAKAPRTLRPLPLLRFAVSATGGAHLGSIQYYLRFWLGICRTSLAVSALRIMRYCLKAITLFAGGGLYHLHFAAAWPMRSYRVLLYNGHSFLPCRICMAGKLCYTKVYLKTKKMADISQTQAGFKAF